MFLKFCKASLCISTAFSLTSFNPFSSPSRLSTQSLNPDQPSKSNAQREAQLAQLLSEYNKRLELQPETQILPLESQIRTPRDFFEKPILESLSKVALYHLCGFIGYLPYVSTIGSYLIAPLIPFNIATDGYLLYSYMNESKEVKIQEKTWTSKEFCKIVDYMSYAFAFVSTGGVARGVPAFLGMLISMYVYARNSGDSFNRNGAVLAGAAGATVPMFLLSFTLPFWIGKYKRIPFAVGVFASYAVLSAFIYKLMEDYIENRNEEKITTAVLSSYKWSYLNLLGLWTLCGAESSV